MNRRLSQDERSAVTGFASVVHAEQSGRMRSAGLTAPGLIVATATLLGLLGRISLVYLAPQHGYSPDHDDFVRWGILSQDYGLTKLYTCAAPRHPHVQYHVDGTTSTAERTFDRILNYPPGAAYIIAAQGWLHARVDQDRWVNTPVARWVYSSLSIFADLLMAWGAAAVVMAGFGPVVRGDDHERRRRRRLSAMTFAAAFLAPPLAVVGSFWSQTDGLLMAAAVWMLWAMMRRRWLLAGLLWGLALALKPQGVLFAPIWLYALLLYTGQRLRIGIGAASALLILNLLAWPFWQSSGWAWVEHAYLEHTSKISHGTTVGRYNLWMLDALNGGSGDVHSKLAGISKLRWGQLLSGAFGLAAFGIAYAKWRRRPLGLCAATACYLLAIVTFPTGVHGRYLVLAVPFLICTAAHVRGVRWAAILFAIGGGFEIPRDFWRDPPRFTHTVSFSPWSDVTDGRSNEKARQAAERRHERHLALHDKLRPQREWTLAVVMTAASLGVFVALANFVPSQRRRHSTLSIDEAEKETSVNAVPSARSASRVGDLVTVAVALLAIKSASIGWGVYTARHVPLDRGNYENNYHHHRLIGRYEEPARFDYFELWFVSDAQWYSAIADDGYPNLLKPRPNQPTHPKMIEHVDSHLKYVFFPLWPMMIRFARLFVGDLHAAGFLAANLCSFAAMLILYHFLARLRNGRTAFWTVILLAVSPFAMFLQVPFTESLFFLWVVLTFVATERRRWLWAGVFIGLAGVTRPNGIFLLIVPSTFFLYDAIRRRKWSWSDFAKLEQLSVAVVPLYCYLLLNKVRTGDPFFFTKAIGWWGYEGSLSLDNLSRVVGGAFERFDGLPWHSFHESQLDFIVMVIALALLLIGFRLLPLHYSAYAAMIVLLPLLTKDLMSYSRYVVVAWPLFFVAVHMVRPKYQNWVFGLLVPLLLLGQLMNMGRFVNWQWVG